MSIGRRRIIRSAGRRFLATSSSPTADAGSVPVGAASYVAPGDAIYVATTGNDTTGTGLIGAPYKTLVKALSVAAANKTIVMRAGTYHEGGSAYNSAVGIKVTKNYITIQNYPGEAVWFDGSSVQTGWTQSGSTWWINWTKVFDHSPTQNSGAADGVDPGWKWINDNYPCAPFPEQVLIDGTPLTQVGSLAACVAGTFYVEGTTTNMIFTPTKLYIGSNPTGKTVNVTDLHQFISLGEGFTNLTLRGVGVRRYGNALPQFACVRFDGNTDAANPTNFVSNGLIENVVFEDISTTAFESNKCHGNTLRNVTVRRAGYRALGGHLSDDLTFDKVLVEYTNAENFNSSPDSGSIKVTQSQRVTVSNSIFRDNKCKGVWFDMSVYDMKVYNNDFFRNKDTDVFFEISGTGICANNLFVDNPAQAIKVDNTNNMQIWNNTIVRCGNSAQRLNPDTSSISTGDPRPFAVYMEARRPANTSYGLDARYALNNSMYTTYMTWVISTISIQNNIVTDTPPTTYIQFCIDDQQVNTGGTGQLLSSYGAVMNGNVFHWASAPTTSPPYPYVFPPTSTTSGSPVIYSTHAQMVAGTGLNANGTEFNPKGSGTSLVSPIDSNYRVTAAQAALHTKATALSSTIATLIGKPSGVKQAGCWR